MYLKYVNKLSWSTVVMYLKSLNQILCAALATAWNLAMSDSWIIVMKLYSYEIHAPSSEPYIKFFKNNQSFKSELMSDLIFSDSGICYSFWMMPSLFLKKMVMGNFDRGLVDSEIADSIDFLVEKVMNRPRHFSFDWNNCIVIFFL